MADAGAMCAEVATRMLAGADDAVRRRARVVVVLAGGNTPRGVVGLLRMPRRTRHDSFGANDLSSSFADDEATRYSGLNEFTLSGARMSSTAQTWPCPLPTLLGEAGDGRRSCSRADEDGERQCTSVKSVRGPSSRAGATPLRESSHA